jgi:hypothetical protein
MNDLPAALDTIARRASKAEITLSIDGHETR